MYRRREKSIENFTTEMFSLENVRLFSLKNDLINNYCLYLRHVSYTDSIEKKYSYKGHHFEAFYSTTEAPDVHLDIIAVRQEDHDKSDQYSASRMNFKNGILEPVSWQPIQDSENFRSLHLQHRLCYYLQLLAKEKSIKELKNHCQSLAKTAANKSEPITTAKFNALNDFINAAETNDYQTVIDVLTDSTHPIYKDLIKPRPYRLNLFFLTLDFTANKARETDTYKLLVNIKFGSSFQNLNNEFGRQNATNLRETTKFIQARHK
jgi:hypothetical protein